MGTSGLIGTIAIVALGFVAEQASTSNRVAGLAFAFVMALGTLAFMASCWYALRALGALVLAASTTEAADDVATRKNMLVQAQRSKKLFMAGLAVFGVALLYYVLVVLVLVESKP